MSDIILPSGVPDPGENLIGFLKALYSELQDVKAELAEVRGATMGPDWVTVKDIARYRKCATSTILERPWLMPLYGRSEGSGKAKSWHRATFDAWDVEARKREWFLMSADDRLKICGIKRRPRIKREAGAVA